MEVLTEAEMAARLDFRRPLKEEPYKQVQGPSLWRIPFEWGGLPKGTLITVAKAKEIAAELRRLVAEAEVEDWRRAFEEEKDRCKTFEASLSKSHEETFQVKRERNVLAEELRRLKRKKTTAPRRRSAPPPYLGKTSPAPRRVPSQKR